MCPLITLPNALVDGVDTIYGADILGNDKEIVRVVHGIDYQNLAAKPNFPGTCISPTAGERLPTDRIEDGAVTGVKLQSDPSIGSALGAIGSSDHIKDGIITKAKMAFGALTGTQLQVDVQTISFNITSWTTFTDPNEINYPIVSASVDRYTVSGNYNFNARVHWRHSNIYYMGSANSFALSPALPAASTIILGAYLSDIAIVPLSTTFGGSLVVLSIPRT